jgi:hypothetical protein
MENKNAFKLCITMAGAVSAGAYTAGVLDYLIETLDLWEQAKAKNKALATTDPMYDHSVPMHEVEIDVLSGSSAGGISGTLAMLAFADKNFKSYNKNNKNGENNIFYKSWVDMADDANSDTLEKLLSDDDLKAHKEVKSLLNTKPIEVIADKAIRILDQRKIPAYVSDSLDLILTTTNLRGLNFLVDFDNSSTGKSKGTVITNHGGFLRYKLMNEKYKLGIPDKADELYYVLDISIPRHLEYLKGATLSTAAFPIGLESRELRISAEYLKRYPKYLFKSPKGITALPPDGAIYTFNSVDGGVINNEPYGIGLKVLREKHDEHCKTEKYAVIMIDPFPNKDHDIEQTGSGIMDIVGGLFKSLRNQVMFNQDGILDALDTSDRTKFLIEPLRKVEVNGQWVRPKSDLASGSVGGFAGFLNKDLRKHDFQLGRKNCQTFLRYHFAIPEVQVSNRLGIPINSAFRQRYEFSVPPKDPNGEKFFPIIPDMRVFRNFDETLDKATYGEDANIELLPFPKVSFKEFEKRYEKLIKNRIGNLVKYMFHSNFLTGLANFLYVKNAGYKFVSKTLKEQFEASGILKDE